MSFFEEISAELGYAVLPTMTLKQWMDKSNAQWREEWE